jgi:DNA-binding NarL/FixJ family response regulator
VDDHITARRGFSSLLGRHPDVDLLREASDGEAAVRMVREIKPDLILMDVKMPKLVGLEATRIIHSEFPDIWITGLSIYETNNYAKKMLNAEESAYLSKTSRPARPFDTISGEDKQQADFQESNLLDQFF